MTADRGVRRDVITAALAAAGAIAFQVAGKATRDALFLDAFRVESLPTMVMVSSGVSLALVGFATRAISRFGPGRIVPALFGVSAALLLLERTALERAPAVTAVAVFLHFGALGALLVSGLWSVVSEQFDPRSAKQQIGWIGAAGTTGGVVGGLVAWQAPVPIILPVLAGIHVLSGFLAFDLGRGRVGRTPPVPSQADGAAPSGLVMLLRSPYLRTLVSFVVIMAIAEGLLDYVFKARVEVDFTSREDLRRFFALFYAGLGVLTAAVLTLASRPALQRLGLAGTIATMPAVVAIGGVGALAAPGLASLAFARAGEVIMRNSLARSAYELFFVPVSAREKRATKTLIDVGVVRVGDAAGAALVNVVLVVMAAAAVSPTLLAGTVLLGAVAIAISRRLHTGYFQTLERSLLARAHQVLPSDMEEVLTRTAMLHSVGDLGLTRHDISIDRQGTMRVDAASHPAATTAVLQPEPVRPADPEIIRLTDLRSSDAGRVRTALAAAPLSPAAAAQAISLLAWDDVARDVVAALRAVADRVTGQLIDRLLDPSEEFAVRRRLPLVLASCRDERAVVGLLRGLEDRRFEVRYRCGRALSRIHDLYHEVPIDRNKVIRAVVREVAVDRAVWESQRLLDRGEDDEWSPVLDEVLRERASRSLEHVFTMLALVLPREPLRVAFRGLHTDDQHLRGTALEYLEHALPAEVREPLWPLLDDARGGKATRPSQQVLDDLLRSNVSINLNLEAMRRHRR